MGSSPSGGGSRRLPGYGTESSGATGAVPGRYTGDMPMWMRSGGGFGGGSVTSSRSGGGVAEPAAPMIAPTTTSAYTPATAPNAVPVATRTDMGGYNVAADPYGPALPAPLAAPPPARLDLARLINNVQAYTGRSQASMRR